MYDHDPIDVACISLEAYIHVCGRKGWDGAVNERYGTGAIVTPELNNNPDGLPSPREVPIPPDERYILVYSINWAIP